MFDGRFALLHFKTELEASTFYHVYCIQKTIVYKKLKGVYINPSLLFNENSLIYNTFQAQPRMSSSNMICSCPAITPNINPSSNTTATSSVHGISQGSSAYTENLGKQIELAK
ncbi:hypothetical protein K501DRAFT_276428 [Backusella circina FSU 941]|nr:hypothetical protein K501DRAFT_276428 [Backusella circina FSU 941]